MRTCDPCQPRVTGCAVRICGLPTS